MTESIGPAPTLRQLAYLLALEEHQHFGRAAAACGVTQSTLSSSLAELERTLDAKLVDRTRRSLSFTEVGREVTQRARSVMRSVADLTEAAQAPREPLSGPLRMAVIPTVAPFLLPRIFEATAARWPKLRLAVREMLTGTACEALQRNAVDCVLLALPVDCGEVVVCEIMEDELLLAVHRSEAAPRSPADDAARLLLLDEGHCLRDHALIACNLSTAPADAPLVAATLPTLIRMVDAGRGSTLLPKLAVEAGVLAGTGVVTRPMRPPMRRRISMVWRQSAPLASDVQLLATTIREAVVQRSCEAPP